MYRTYENPVTLENRLQAVIEERDRLKAMGELDIMEEYDYAMEIIDLTDRINFAYQDEED